LQEHVERLIKAHLALAREAQTRSIETNRIYRLSVETNRIYRLSVETEQIYRLSVDSLLKTTRSA
jgi:hypothetical protein